MKRIYQFITVSVIIILSTLNIKGQSESTGMPGDHFSLEGALQLFEKAKSPEHFEELLNKEDNGVNNLDLNNDEDIDYIRVVDLMDSEAHAITLQVPIGKDESQDIAVIAIEKTGEESATLQIIGDEDIYGEELIVEPYEETAISEGKGGPSAEYSLLRIHVNVWVWPSVRYVYRPVYRPYVSPWRWAHYPGWWRPWRPVSWAYYGPRVSGWRIGFRYTPTIRVTRARNIYTPRRRTSVTVVNRYSVNKKTYVKRGNRTTVSKTNKTVIRKNNSAVAARTSTKKVIQKNGSQKTTVNKSSTQVAKRNGSKKVTAKKKTKTSKLKAKKGNKKANKKVVKKTKKVKKR